MATRAETAVTSQAAPAPASATPGPQFGLAGVYYWSEEQFREDLAKIFYGHWLFAAHECELPSAGDYVTFSIGRDSIILSRDKSGEIRALFNSCRHRGSLLCDQPKGHANKFVCPYHQWVYGLDGQLEQCRLMPDDVDKSDYSLHQAHVEVVHGFIFVCVGKQAPDFEPARRTFSRFFAPHCTGKIKPCVEIDYTIKANWKTIFDNNRECYHCATSHKEFCLSNFDYGMPGDARSSREFVEAHARAEERWAELGLEAGPVSFPEGEWFRCMRFPLKSGFVTESLDGQPVGPVIGDLPDHDVGSLRVVGLPNMWFHLNADYFMTTRLVPVSAAETKSRVVWYVREDAVEGRDYDPAKVADVWRLTSEQDWKLCEMNQAGLQSTRYVPGPLSALAEQGVSHFAGWYLSQLGKRPPENWEPLEGIQALDRVDDLLRSESENDR